MNCIKNTKTYSDCSIRKSTDSFMGMRGAMQSHPNHNADLKALRHRPETNRVGDYSNLPYPVNNKIVQPLCTGKRPSTHGKTLFLFRIR